MDAVSVSGRLAEDPTVTLPKFRLDGVTPRVAVFGFTPVPETLIASLGVGALLTMEIFAVMVPLTAGAKLTGSCTLFPGWTVTGTGKLPNVKFVLFLRRAMIVTFALPTLVS